MNLEILTACDFASTLEGKLIIIGAFDQINTREFPATHPSLSIAIRLRFDPSEVGLHNFKVTLADEQSENLIEPIEGQINMNMPGNLLDAPSNFTITLGNLTFQKETRARLRFEVDNNLMGEIPLYIRLIKNR